ncbi:unnamed protein product [Caenorhabditis brenneri]
MTKTIETKDSGAIADLFAEDFFFKGCIGDYDKSKIVALIGKVPAGSAFSFAFKSAKYHSADKIDYLKLNSCSVSKLESCLEGVFLFAREPVSMDSSLSNLPKCSRTHASMTSGYYVGLDPVHATRFCPFNK